MAEMDAADIDVQVLSLNSPGIEQADVAEQIAIARESNDYLADVVKQNPKRFAAFAALPVAAPERAPDERSRPASAYLEFERIGFLRRKILSPVPLDASARSLWEARTRDFRWVTDRVCI